MRGHERNLVAWDSGAARLVDGDVFWH